MNEKSITLLVYKTSKMEHNDWAKNCKAILEQVKARSSAIHFVGSSPFDFMGCVAAFVFTLPEHEIAPFKKLLSSVVSWGSASPNITWVSGTPEFVLEET